MFSRMTVSAAPQHIPLRRRTTSLTPTRSHFGSEFLHSCADRFSHPCLLFASTQCRKPMQQQRMLSMSSGISALRSEARLVHTSPSFSSSSATVTTGKEETEEQMDAAGVNKTAAAAENGEAPLNNIKSVSPVSATQAAASGKDAVTAFAQASGRLETDKDAAASSSEAESSDRTTSHADGEEKTKEESWWHRKWRSFKSEGKDFSLFYLPFYPATFVLLYVAFAVNALHKESVLDYVLSFMGDYVDRKKMYARIEAWNTWANLGFAFVINELLEVVRFPAVVVLYYALKPYSTYFARWLQKGMRHFRRSKSKVSEMK